MWRVWGFLCLASLAFSAPTNDTEVPFVEPEVLEQLLANGDYEEFSRLLRIDNVNLVIPKEGDEDPMLHEELPQGDILPSKGHKEQERSILNFEKFTYQKWPRGIVPYSIVTSGYSRSQLSTIQNAIREFNSRRTGVRFVRRRNQRDYVMIFSGEGCYSVVGRTGNQQPLSIQAGGCTWRNTVQHEMMHAIGFGHEHTRPDRDNHVRILWDNIPQEWHSQYNLDSAEDMVITADYDYYSVMHYGMYAPGTGKEAFEIYRQGIDKDRVGNPDGMTGLDVQKIRNSYC